MKLLNFEALKFIAEENREKRVLITFHSIGDTDSVSSAVALSKYFKNSKIVTPDMITANAARLMKRFGFAPENITNIFDPKNDLVIMVDVNNFEDCGPFRYHLESFPGNILIVDHHALKEIEKDTVNVFNDESFNSAASIVFRLLEALNYRLDKNASGMVLAGIISDSADLRNAAPATFVQIGVLLSNAGLEYTEMLEIMQHVAEPQARLRTIEDVVHSKKDIMGDMLFMTGRAHAHANLAADSAIKIGADVALFYSESEKEVSFSARLRSPLDRRLGIHLGVVMKQLAKTINGNGGGHPCAAGAYGPVAMLEKADEFTQNFIVEVMRHAKRK